MKGEVAGSAGIAEKRARSPFLVTLPWATLRPPERGREYVVLVSVLRLTSFRTVPAFFSYSNRIQGQLKRSPGLIGFSLNAHLLRKMFWTLSVWESPEAIADFVNESPHREIMAALKGKIRDPRFIQWRISGFQCPPTWAHAFQMAEEKL